MWLNSISNLLLVLLAWKAESSNPLIMCSFLSNDQPPSHPVQSVQSLSHVQLFATPWTAACQASLSITNSRSLLKLMSISSKSYQNANRSCLISITHKKLKSFWSSVLRTRNKDSWLNHIYCAMLLSTKKKWSTRHATMFMNFKISIIRDTDQIQKTDNMLYDSIYLKCPGKANLQR